MASASPSKTVTRFGELLHELRESRGLPQHALGHPSTICKYERGERLPRSRKSVVAMAQALAVDPGILFDALGWPHRPVPPKIHALRDLLESDPAAAVQAAQAGLDRAQDDGHLDQILAWQELLADARRAVGAKPLPIDLRGRADIDAWRIRATDLIQQDGWYAAGVVLESLLAHMPEAHPSYGNTVYNLAVAEGALGDYPAAEAHAHDAWSWAVRHQECPLAIVACGAIVHAAVMDRRPAPLGAVKALRSYAETPSESQQFVSLWLEAALALEAAFRGDVPTADHYACSVRHRVDRHAELAGERLTAALVQGAVLEAQQRYAIALAVLDPALIEAMERNAPGYALVDALVLATECAVLGEDLSGPSRIAWLQGWLGGLQAHPQLDRVSARLGLRVLAAPEGADRCPLHYRAYWEAGFCGTVTSPHSR